MSKFNKLADSILKENVEGYIPGQWVGDNYIVLGKSVETPGHYNVAEVGEQDVYPGSEMEDTGETIGGMQVMKWSHTGEDIIVSNDKTEDGDYVGYPIEGGYTMSPEDLAGLEDGSDY
jgi:hypothetical protein